MSPTEDTTLAQVAGALALVALAIGVSVWRRADVERDIGEAVVRAFVQLTAIGFVIEFIFDQDGLALVAILLAVQIIVGAYTARARARSVPAAFGPLVLALALAGFGTVGLTVALGIFDPEPQALVPVGGMVVGNSMTAAAVALNRLGDDITQRRGELEATLALGATWRQAVAPIARRSLTAGLIPLIDQTKTTGLISFPGIMVGMLLAGAEPSDAVRLQLVLLYVLLGSIAISALVAVSLGSRGFFTVDHQLREPRGL